MLYIIHKSSMYLPTYFLWPEKVGRPYYSTVYILYGLDFYVLDFFSILSDLPLTREIDTKKLSNFEKLQFLNDRIDQNTNFAKLPSAKWLFWYNYKL